jgi:PLP dependent protein
MIKDNLTGILSSLPSHVTLVAVSKTKPVELLQEVYDAGHRDFGENKVQELVEKYEKLPKDIRWHLIGHLQTNKVKYIAEFVHLIHTVDSLKLLLEINKQAARHHRVIDCLLQFHIAEEETKFGLSYEECRDLLQSTEFAHCKHVRICGVMGMATFTENTAQIRKEFAQLKTYFQQLKSEYFAHEPSFSTVSMGMSGDYVLAVEEGSTMVRVGSSLFGTRN